MFRLCIHFDRREKWKYWELIFQFFKVDHLYVLGLPDDQYDYTPTGVPMTPILSVSEIPGELVIWNEKNASYTPGDVSMLEFTHPSDATYYFGSDEDHIRGRAHASSVVFIPSADPHAPGLWSYQAAAIALFDRTRILTVSCPG